jgi:hypothetical protein
MVCTGNVFISQSSGGGAVVVISDIVVIIVWVFWEQMTKVDWGVFLFCWFDWPWADTTV